MALARICRHAENAFVGVACGLMDQAASASAAAGAALLLDCRTGEKQTIPLPDEVAIVVCDSGVGRQLAMSAYAVRRGECEASVAAIRAAGIEAQSLRDVTADDLDGIADHLDPTLLARARHVVDENTRVLAFVDALERRDLDEAGRLMTASHASLRDRFEVSSPPLDALVEIALDVPGVLGSRLTGAGFGGCTVALVRQAAVMPLADAVAARYPEQTGREATVFEVRASAGAEVVGGWA
jgi:galactokinase